jgi:hypothetical protein
MDATQNLERDLRKAMTRDRNARHDAETGSRGYVPSRDGDGTPIIEILWAGCKELPAKRKLLVLSQLLQRARAEVTHVTT